MHATCQRTGMQRNSLWCFNRQLTLGILVPAAIIHGPVPVAQPMQCQCSSARSNTSVAVEHDSLPVITRRLCLLLAGPCWQVNPSLSQQLLLLTQGLPLAAALLLIQQGSTRQADSSWDVATSRAPSHLPRVLLRVAGIQEQNLLAICCWCCWRIG